MITWKKNSRKKSLMIKKRKVRVDAVLASLVEWINKCTNMETLGCCCGHGKYPPTIVVRYPKDEIFDFLSGVVIPRTRNFYYRDEQGIFYIPEVIEQWGNAK